MALVGLSKCEAASMSAVVDALPKPDIAPTDHHREHHAGRASKLDADAVVGAFVMARLNRLAFDLFEADIKKRFPKDRYGQVFYPSVMVK